MKLALLVCNSYHMEIVMRLLEENGIDYFTSWDNVRGKGHGTEPHLGTKAYASTNTVTMIGFEQDAPLEALLRSVTAANAQIVRPADRIRVFQLPLERIV